MYTYQDDEELNFVFVYLKNRIRKMKQLSEIFEATCEFNPAEYALFQNVPAPNSVVERLFSKLQNVITNIRNFSDDNVKYYVVSYINMLFD